MSSTITLSGYKSDLASLNDIELLQALAWERGADPALKAAATAGDVDAVQSALLAALQPQATGRESALGCGARTLWSLAAFPEEADLGKLLSQVAGLSGKPRAGQKRATNKAPKTLAQRIEPLIRRLTTEEDNDEPSEPVSPFAVVAALEVLALAGARLRPEQLWKLWRHSLSQIVQLIRTNTDEDAHDPTIPADVQLIERGELPFVAGALFGDVAGAADLIKAGRKVLARSLSENADSDGTPRAEMIERLPLWLAPLIRASLIAK
ncbi:MAG: hypothetical protein H7062_00645, partial [Candidatus Saccharimonas sp.]|nr:hypothetical protein [Planctomycetaceae bacterium]